jgi:hypothetical protein
LRARLRGEEIYNLFQIENGDRQPGGSLALSIISTTSLGSNFPMPIRPFSED